MKATTDFPCRRCMAFSQNEQNLLEALLAYKASLPSKEKVSEKVYHERLQACETCEDLQGGMCRYCGCFVLVRAVKKRLSCPSPKLIRWEAYIKQ